VKLNYDNYEDAKTKLVGTYCMYKGKAFVLKVLTPSPVVENQYTAQGASMFSGRVVECDINDPEFNCSNYNIGYLNLMRAAAWFYRVPSKQYKQGLRPDQVRLKASQRCYAEIGFSSGKNLCNMLENVYPSFDGAMELLRSDEANIVAFHVARPVPQRNAPAAVDAAHMAARHADHRRFHGHVGHAFGFFDGAPDGTYG